MCINVVVFHLVSSVIMCALHKVRYGSEWLSVTHKNESCLLANGDCDDNAIAKIQRFISNIELNSSFQITQVISVNVLNVVQKWMIVITIISASTIVMFNLVFYI